jgi:hypothetical protein
MNNNVDTLTFPPIPPLSLYMTLLAVLLTVPIEIPSAPRPPLSSLGVRSGNLASGHCHCCCHHGWGEMRPTTPFIGLPDYCRCPSPPVIIVYVLRDETEQGGVKRWPPRLRMTCGRGGKCIIVHRCSPRHGGQPSSA